MGLFDIPCDGCTRKFPVDTATEGTPKPGHVRNLGGVFNTIYVCDDCWNYAEENGFRLGDSKDEVKRWKESAPSLRKKQTQQEAERKAKFESLSEDDKRRSFLVEAEQQMLEELTPQVMELVEDILLPDERIIFKIRSSPDGDRSQLILTNKNLILINKGLRGGQAQDVQGLLGTLMAVGRVSIRIYRINEIRSIEIQPLQGVSVGHFQVLTNATSEDDNESKFLFDTPINYYKSILIYRKLRQLQLSPNEKVGESNPLHL